MKLFSVDNPTSWCIFKAIESANYGDNSKLEMVTLTQQEMKNPKFKKMSPQGRWPVLQFNEEQHVTQHFTCYRAVARSREDTQLFGRNPTEGAQVEMWLEHMQEFNQILGYEDFDGKLFCQCAQWFEKYMSKLNKWLMTRSFMVGYGLTLADLVVTFHLLNYFRFYTDKKIRDKYCNVTRYFDFMVHQPAIEKQTGRVWFCEVQLLPYKWESKESLQKSGKQQCPYKGNMDQIKKCPYVKGMLQGGQKEGSKCPFKGSGQQQLKELKEGKCPYKEDKNMQKCPYIKEMTEKKQCPFKGHKLGPQSKKEGTQKTGQKKECPFKNNKDVSKCPYLNKMKKSND